MLVLKSKAAGSSNSDKPGTRRTVTDYAKSGTVLTLETGGTPAAAAVRCIGHDYERHTIRCIAAAHMLAAKS